jgi:hypothetical protein
MPLSYGADPALTHPVVFLLRDSDKQAAMTRNLILPRNQTLFVQRLEIRRDSEKYPTACSFQIT